MNIQRKRKKENSLLQQCFQRSSKRLCPFVHSSLPFMKDPRCLLQSGCYFALHATVALTPSYRTSFSFKWIL